MDIFVDRKFTARVSTVIDCRSSTANIRGVHRVFRPSLTYSTEFGNLRNVTEDIEPLLPI